MFLSQL